MKEQKICSGQKCAYARRKNRDAKYGLNTLDQDVIKHLSKLNNRTVREELTQLNRYKDEE